MALRLASPPKRRRPTRPRSTAAPRPSGAGAFPIVGVGASAGGLEAFIQLLALIPADAGLAFVLVQHAEEGRGGLGHEALAQATGRPISQAVQGTVVAPNGVYLAPPGALVSIQGGVLQLEPPQPAGRGPHLPIDHFLRSLAADRGRQAIGLVLSGTASDGTAGLAEIRAQGGITLAQDPGTARLPELPQRAVDAGVVDVCLPLPTLGAELLRLTRHPYLASREPGPPGAGAAAALGQVIGLVRAATGVDFAEYQPATLRRRLARRMALRQIAGLDGYLELLHGEPAEVTALFDDLLVQVTSFFRDEACFDDLERLALPDLLGHKAPGAPLRAWVIGCATGEEVYSLAISILEQVGEGPPTHPVLIFGSDLSERAIEVARAGVYPDAAVAGISPERLKRFFDRTDRGWRVNRAVRELCVFVRHDVARDPPFSKLDLVSCRNVLIYFGPALQRRVLAAAHYALLRPGYLMLGRTESGAGAPRWFTPATKTGLFLRRAGPSAFRFAPRAGAMPRAGPGTHALPPTSLDRVDAPRADGGPARQIDELVLARYGPPGVLVNERLEVIQYRGRTGPFLEAPHGAPQSLLLKLVRPGLLAPLRLALGQAQRSSAPVRKERIRLEGPAGPTCDLMVIPVPAAAGSEAGLLVLFEPHPPEPGRPTGRGGRRGRVEPGRQVILDELASTKDHLAVLLEEQGRGTEALNTANDELVSSNEELQSLNEELETAKEEVQASNEELTTLNDELHDRNQELLRVNADVLNLLDAVELPILMIDADRRLGRFTHRAESFLGLGPGDIGRRLAELSLPIHAPDLQSWITRAMEQSTLVEAEVHDRADRWHRLQIRPRRGADGRVDGALLSLVDIDALRHEVLLAQMARDYARSIVEAVQVPLLVLDARLQVLSANAAYFRRFRAPKAATEGRDFFELEHGAWDASGLRRALSQVLGEAGSFRDVEVECRGLGDEPITLSISGSPVTVSASTPFVLVALEDVTERRQVERRRADLLALAEEARQRAERADAAKDQFLGHLSHELRTPLTAILLQAELLRSGRTPPDAVVRAATTIEVCTRRQARLIEDLLDVTRSVAGKLTLASGPVELRALVEEALEPLQTAARAKGVRLLTAPGEPVACLGDPGRLQQVVTNLVGNAIKFTPAEGRVEVAVDSLGGRARLVVQDTGQGMAAAFVPRVFERFAQEGSDPSKNPGLGLGLAIVQDLVRLHGGDVTASSPGPGLGATFIVTLPQGPAPVSAA